MADTDLNSVFRAAVKEAATFPISAFKASVTRSGDPGLALADSLGSRVVTMSNRPGAYAIVGEKIVNGRTAVKHFHAQEKGTTLRFRKRIGGKFAWVEDVIDGLSAQAQTTRRRTGMVTGKHWLQHAFDSQMESMILTIQSTFRQRVIQKYVGSRLTAVSSS